MKKSIIITLLLLILFGCDNGNPTSNTPTDNTIDLRIPDHNFTNTNQCIFAINKNNSTTEYIWDAGTTGVGFVDMGTSFSVNFKDENSEMTQGFKNYFFVEVDSNSEGKYTDADGKNSLIFYDSQGNSYASNFTYMGTSLSINITKWSDSEITGTFTGKLYCYQLAEYATVAGKFNSLDSSIVTKSTSF